MSKTSFNAMVSNDDWNAGKHKYEQTRLAQKRGLGKQTCHNEAIFLRKICGTFSAKNFFHKNVLVPEVEVTTTNLTKDSLCCRC